MHCREGSGRGVLPSPSTPPIERCLSFLFDALMKRAAGFPAPKSHRMVARCQSRPEWHATKSRPLLGKLKPTRSVNP